MSFIPFIRDYIELLNTLYDSFANDINLQKIIQEIFIYLAQTGKFIVIYTLSFQWFRDILYLPILIPQISNSIIKETFFLQNPLENVFNILEIPTYSNNKFLIGFLNSFFLALPFSCAHLLYVRRFLIQGNVAGIAAGLGNIFGQLFFIGSVLLGFRFFLIPWFSIEPLSYIVGFIFLLTIIYDMVHERVIKIIDWNNQKTILKIFFLHFFLIWTEQSCIFQYLGNITLNSNSSIIESSTTQTYISFFSTHIFYLFGLLFGSIFFNFMLAVFLKNITEFIQIKFAILRSTWIIRLNSSLLTLILAFTFTSIPFYGVDYLLTQPLGFISQDRAFKNTIFSPNEIGDPFGILGGFSENLSLDTDVNSFDRGVYLQSPSFKTFEDLNYSGEYATIIRQGNIPLFDQYKEKARKIREILVKKPESDTDKSIETKNNSQIFTTQNTTKTSQVSSLPYTSDVQPSGSFGGEGLHTNGVLDISSDYPTYYPIDKNVYISSNIQKRFENNYKESSNIIFENILQGSLNNVFADEKFTVAYPEIDKKLKQKYYSNPIYKFLVTIDIDSFLQRQPSEFLLSPTEEQDLYKKRLLLARYNDTLRFYNTLPYTDEFQYFFNGSKSFADRVYNQQFKGTLHVVRRLFSISFDGVTKNPHELVLKYDQPLFISTSSKNNDFKTLQNPIYHEELQEYVHSNSERLDNSIHSVHSLGMEEMDTQYTSTQEENTSSTSPLFELVSQSPLYIGWDEDLRKIIITNRLLPKSITNFYQPIRTLTVPLKVVISGSNDIGTVYNPSTTERATSVVQYETSKDLNVQQKNSLRENSTFPGVQFTTWPIEKSKLEDGNTELLTNSRLLFETKKSLQRLNYTTLLPFFEYEDTEAGLSYYEALPNNVIQLASGIGDVLPPNRGGFIWPGNSPLKFSIKDIFKT